MNRQDLLSMCEDAYARFHDPRYIDPDPLLIVREQARRDQEAAAFLIAGLSLGRVQGILSVARRLMTALGGFGNIVSTLTEARPEEIRAMVGTLSWRFFDPDSISDYCVAIASVLRGWGSIEACFAEGLSQERDRVRVSGTVPPSRSKKKAGDNPLADFHKSPALRGLDFLRYSLQAGVFKLHPMIFSDPMAGGAQKRLHLCLRWLVRDDRVDLGLWTVLRPSELWVPIDTHMLRHCLSLGLIRRSAADARSVVEVTEAFRSVMPEDPVKYDFCLSRMGIHPGASAHEPEFYSR